MQRRYGWRRDKLDHRDFTYRLTAPVKLPPDLDKRSIQAPVFDQTVLGACTGAGIKLELESEALVQGEPYHPLSALFIYYNERVMEHTVFEDAGAEIRDGIKSVAKLGVCSESDWPYITRKFAVKPRPNCYTDALKFRALLYQRVPQTLTSIKAALVKSPGIVLGISVYESFESDGVAKTGIVPMPAPDERVLGGHCVRLVGYTNRGIPGIPEQHFIGMNSWGPSWGLAGFFAIPYTYITNPKLADDLWIIEAVS